VFIIRNAVNMILTNYLDFNLTYLIRLIYQQIYRCGRIRKENLGKNENSFGTFSTA